MFKFFATVIFGMVMSTFGAFLTWFYWTLFIVPNFPSAPHLTYHQCFAASLCVGLEFIGVHIAITTRDMDVVETCWMTAIMFVVAMLLGIVWHVCGV